MGWSEGEKRCTKHPEHKQSKGVCPYCLREKLHHISASSSSPASINGSCNTSTSSPYSDDSSYARRLKKSRSLLFAFNRKEKEKRKEMKEEKKKRKGRFWSRVLERDGSLEKPTRWTLFS